MKVFSNLKQLYDYCLFCPLCNKYCRTIRVSGDCHQFESFTHLNYSIRDDYLNLEFTYTNNGQSTFIKKTFTIDLRNNKITSDTITDDEAYFFIEGNCETCKATSFSSDFDLNSKIEKPSLEREVFHLFKNNIGYCIDIFHDSDTVEIYKSSYNNKKINTIGSKLKSDLELFDLDFSDLDKLYNKIQTIVLFS